MVSTDLPQYYCSKRQNNYPILQHKMYPILQEYLVSKDLPNITAVSVKRPTRYYSSMCQNTYQILQQ